MNTIIITIKQKDRSATEDSACKLQPLFPSHRFVTYTLYRRTIPVYPYVQLLPSFAWSVVKFATGRRFFYRHNVTDTEDLSVRAMVTTVLRPVRTIKFTDINIFVGVVIFARLIYCSVSLCSGGRITTNISSPYRTKIEYFIRWRGINNSYSRPAFSGQLKSFCRVDDTSYARENSDIASICVVGIRKLREAVCKRGTEQNQGDSYITL